jgi:hypothetical protein
MNIKVHYEEVANYVEKHCMIRPQLKRIDDIDTRSILPIGSFHSTYGASIHMKLCAMMLCACLRM